MAFSPLNFLLNPSSPSLIYELGRTLLFFKKTALLEAAVFLATADSTAVVLVIFSALFAPVDDDAGLAPTLVVCCVAFPVGLLF